MKNRLVPFVDYRHVCIAAGPIGLPVRIRPATPEEQATGKVKAPRETVAAYYRGRVKEIANNRRK